MQGVGLITSNPRFISLGFPLFFQSLPFHPRAYCSLRPSSLQDSLNVFEGAITLVRPPFAGAAAYALPPLLLLPAGAVLILEALPGIAAATAK